MASLRWIAGAALAMSACEPRPVSRAERGAIERLAGDERAPEVSVAWTDGAALSLRSLRGRWVLVHFWASWCAPCVRELPAIAQWTRELERDGALVVVPIATSDDARSSRQAQRASGLRSTLDPDGAAARAFGASTLPDSYLVAPDGTLVARVRGARDWTAPALRAAILGATREGR